MRKKTISFLLGCLAMPLMAQVAPLEGFYYGTMQQKKGRRHDTGSVILLPVCYPQPESSK